MLAVVVMARQTTKAAASGAIFVGEDTTVPDASSIDIFKNPENHAAAVSSILVYSAEREAFIPSVFPAESLAASHPNFIKRASTFPGFFPTHSEQQSTHFNGSLIQFEKIVRDSAYKHGVLIGRGMRDMVPGYIPILIPGKTLDPWILNLIVIDKPVNSDEIELQLLYVALEIKTDEHFNAIIPEQRISIHRSIFSVKQSYLTEYAERLSEMIGITKVRDTIEFFASPKSLAGASSFAATCHGIL
ncbi:hypothetical protein DFQ27_003286 [Actinomortierella ambigua]|uniref:Uncharacterized protein n=1 Tax=Actinomortierella ambigua TaxID=1343610 RepID=A0A9P6U5U9_9FUNG|nr:hypothetical protein DFQ27_003286 [Actinomortierella ambigua]